MTEELSDPPAELSAKTKKEIADLMADALRPHRSELDSLAREQKDIKAALDTVNVQLKGLRDEVRTLFTQYNSLTQAVRLLENEVSKWRI